MFYINNNKLISIIILIIWICLTLWYCLYVIIEETKKYNRLLYYKRNFLYDIYYDKYMKMVKKMKRIIFKKKTELFFLNILVFFKELFVCKK